MASKGHSHTVSKGEGDKIVIPKDIELALEAASKRYLQVYDDRWRVAAVRKYAGKLSGRKIAEICRMDRQKVRRIIKEELLNGKNAT